MGLALGSTGLLAVTLSLAPRSLPWTVVDALLAGAALVGLYHLNEQDSCKLPSKQHAKTTEKSVILKSETVAPTAAPPLSQSIPLPCSVAHQEQLDALKTTFLQLADPVKSPVGPDTEPWQMVLSRSSPNPESKFKIQVHQKRGSDFTFRIVVDIEALPEETFDYMSDITVRPDWDEVCEGAGVLESVDHMTCIQASSYYTKTKSI